MIDLHLINVALAGLGAGVGVVLLIAAAIFAIAAIGRRGHAARRVQPVPVRAASASTGPVGSRKDQVREPALR